MKRLFVFGCSAALLMVTAIVAQAPIGPSKISTDALSNTAAAATATREAYINACRSLADDFGVKLPITITSLKTGGSPPNGSSGTAPNSAASTVKPTTPDKKSDTNPPASLFPGDK